MLPVGLLKVVPLHRLRCCSLIAASTPDKPSVAASAAVSTPASLIGADQARQLLKALADPIRLDVVQALTGGERCVCELTEQLGLAQSRLSFHLRVMRDAGLIEAREQGRWVYYKLRPEAVEQLQAWLAGIAASSRQPARPCC